MRSSSTDKGGRTGGLEAKKSLATAATEHGTLREIAANRPLPIDDPRRWWYVATGTVDVFLVHAGGGAASRGRPEDGRGTAGSGSGARAAAAPGQEAEAGRRTHLMTRHAGDVVFGVGAGAAGGGRLLVIGRMDAELRELDTTFARESADLHPEMIGPIERWIEGWSEAAATRVTPRPAIDARPRGGTAAAATGERIGGPTSGVVWIAGLGGAAFLDVTDAGDAEAPFPLDARTWMTMAADARLACRQTAAVLADGSWLAGLARFHGVALENIRTNISFGFVDEVNRIRSRERIDASRLRGTLHHVASVGRTTGAPRRSSGSDDPLAKAMGAIADRLQSRRPTLERHERELGPIERLTALAASGGLRIRNVRLRSGWWRRSGHACVAWDEKARPCALLPDGRAGYRRFDPETGETTPVTEAQAAMLQPAAWAVYGSLTAPRLSGSRLLEYAMRGARRDGLALAGYALATAATGLIAPVATRELVSTAIPFGEHGRITELALVLAGAGLVGGAFFFLCGNACIRLQALAEAQAQTAVMDRLLRLPAAFFRTMPTATLARRALGVSQVRRVVARGAVVTTLGSCLIASNLAVMAWFSPALGALAAGTTAAAATVFALLNRWRLRFEKQALETEGRTTGSAVQLIRAMAKLRVAGAERRVFSLWMESHARHRHWMYRTRLADNAVFTVTTATPAVLALLFFSLAGADLPAAPGDFVAVLTAFSGFTIGFAGVARELTLALSAIVHFDRVRPILETAPEAAGESRRVGALKGRIDVAHVTFRYHPESPPVLQDLSIRAEAGRFVAVAGPSGSGKSTLLRLLLGFEQPDNGAVFYDGQELDRIDVGSVRRQLGVVLQEAELSPGTLLENIVGVEPAGEDEAWEAAELAGIAGEIRAMPMGMHTFVSQGGVFSGGQRQRLVLARALVRRPKILLLDEATSALDNKTQSTIAGNIERLDMTRIVIAHRLSTIRGANLIYVLDEHGRLAEEGRYEDLMEQDGLFARMARRQTL